MKGYKAVVKDSYDNTIVILDNVMYYHNKQECIRDLRRNGYRVNPNKVKEHMLFDYIMNNTNCNPWDWDLTEIPIN